MFKMHAQLIENQLFTIIISSYEEVIKMFWLTLKVMQLSVHPTAAVQVRRSTTESRLSASASVCLFRIKPVSEIKSGFTAHALV